MRAAFVYPNSRRALIAGVSGGTEPDSVLHGGNHLHEYGINVRFYDPLLTRRPHRPSLERIAWNLRELTVPFELRGIDVVYTPLGVAGLPLAAELRRLPVVVMNFWLNSTWRRASSTRRRWLQASLGAAARIICFGQAQAREFIELTDLSEDHVESLLMPIDDVFFAPAPRPAQDGPARVVVVGKDLARDYATVAAAVESLDATVDFLTLPRNLKGIRLPSNVNVVPYVPSTDLRDLYTRADCVVVAQRRDAFVYGAESGGLTALLEGMAMGRPVVATERAILSDYVDDGVEALLIPPEDPAAMRAAIERTLADPELARSLGVAGRARVERAHTTRGFAAQLAPILRDVVYGGRT